MTHERRAQTRLPSPRFGYTNAKKATIPIQSDVVTGGLGVKTTTTTYYHNVTTPSVMNNPDATICMARTGVMSSSFCPK